MCLEAACDFQKSGFNLLVVQHLKWLWRLVSNVDCCSQFNSGEIGVWPIRPVERYSDSAKSFCWVNILRMHFLGVSAQLPEWACCEWMLVWARVDHFCYKLDRVKACFAYCVTFCSRRPTALSLANTVAQIIGIFVLPTLNYTYCFIIHKAKDAKVSFKNYHRLCVSKCS